MACAPRCPTLPGLLVLCNADSLMRGLQTLPGVLLPPNPCWRVGARRPLTAGSSWVCCVIVNPLGENITQELSLFGFELSILKGMCWVPVNEPSGTEMGRGSSPVRGAGGPWWLPPAALTRPLPSRMERGAHHAVPPLRGRGQSSVTLSSNKVVITPSSLCHRSCSTSGCPWQGGPAWELLPPPGDSRQ